MIYENDIFVVTTGKYESKEEREAYLVTNKDTGIVEFVTTRLVDARHFANHMANLISQQDGELAAGTKNEELDVEVELEEAN